MTKSNGHKPKARLFRGGGSPQAKAARKRVSWGILRSIKRKRRN